MTKSLSHLTNSQFDDKLFAINFIRKKLLKQLIVRKKIFTLLLLIGNIYFPIKERRKVTKNIINKIVCFLVKIEWLFEYLLVYIKMIYQLMNHRNIDEG